jgi:hypothetical protein
MPELPDAPPASPANPLRFLGRGVLALLVLYGVLWMTGRATMPDTYALASLEGFEEVVDAYAAEVRAGSLDDHALGFEALQRATRRPLGLFPHYDVASVQRAVRSLTRAYEGTPDPAQRAELAFFLAKAHLMKGDVPAAQSWLETVRILKTTAYRTEAEALLERLPTPDG